MLKEKDKRIVLLVIFGAALVSLITATVAGLVDSLMVYFDVGMLQRVTDLYYVIAGILTGLSVLCIAYICVKIFVRKSLVPSFVLALVIICYVFVTAIVLRFQIPTKEDSGYLQEDVYVFFQSTYSAVAVTLAVSVAIVETSHFLIVRMDRKQAKEAEAQAEEKLQMKNGE